MYAELEARRRAADPSERVVAIERQVKFELIPAQRLMGVSEKGIRYIADFVVEYANGRREVIDVKSPHTRKLAVYVIKRKLMLWRHGLRVIEA